jgi:hypothetical protein
VQGRHEVDVEGALCLELEHHLGDARGGDGKAKALLGDLVVLAESGSAAGSP